MNNASTSVASRRYAGGFVLPPSVRSHLTCGVAVASAGILAAGLVAAPPDVKVANAARTEVRAVHLAALALPLAAPSGALPEKFINDQALTVVPVTQVVGDATGIATAVATIPRTFVRVVQPSGSPTQQIRATAEPQIDPAISSQVVNNTALASTIEPIDVFGLIFAAGFVVFFVAGIFVQYVLFTLFSVIEGPCCDASGLVVAGASTATVEEKPPTAPTLTGDPLLGDSSPDITATEGPADEAQATVTDQAVSTGRKQATETDQAVSTGRKQATETDQAVSTGRKQATETDQATSSKQRGGSDQATSSKQRGGSDQAMSGKQRGGSDQASSQPTKRANTSAAGHSSAASS
jgi:hypothetical protein